jgi:Pyridoxamine 5'-phosphate oxidase
MVAGSRLNNTEVHRQKFRNVERDPRATVMIWDKEDPYSFVEVRGEVVGKVEGPEARDHIDELTERATPRNNGQPRAKEFGLPKPVVQHGATPGNESRRILALGKVAGSITVGHPLICRGNTARRVRRSQPPPLILIRTAREMVIRAVAAARINHWN